VKNAAHRAGVWVRKGERVRNWRIISTIAAVVFAAIAGILVWKYLSNADSRAEKKKELVSVLVAKTRISRGTVFDTIVGDKLFEEKKIPRESLPPNQILPDTDAKLLEIYKGRVAAADIFQVTPLVGDQFVVASQLVSTVAGAIPKGKQAITVSLDQTHSVGGFVTPGDKVNVLLNYAVLDDKGNSTGHKATAFLLPGVKVIAVGSSTVLPQQTNTVAANGATTTTQPQSQPASLITLQVTPRQAEQIVQATTLGTVWLSLNPPDFTAGTFQNPTDVVDEINLFNTPQSEAQRRAQQVQDLPSAADLVP